MKGHKMLGDHDIITPEDMAFFGNVAAVSATLLGLTFIALSFFLLDILRRYEGIGLPVFRDRDEAAVTVTSKRKYPFEFLTDRQLLDGDPLVVFIAFCVAVTWDLFLMPMTLGLTVVWGGARLGVLASEIGLFSTMLIFCFKIRNDKVRELRPYLTREELLWPLFGGIGLGIFALTGVIVLISALSGVVPGADTFAIWHHWGISDTRAAIFVVKLLCLLALLLGTYNVNKDMFIFFKAVAAERMRQKWLDSFLEQTYPKLKERVNAVISDAGGDSQGVRSLIAKWNDGFPGMVFLHSELKDAEPDLLRKLWIEILSRRYGTAGWMLDVPCVASWVASVEDALRHPTVPTASSPK